MWLIVLGVLEQHLVHVRAGVLVQFVAATEDYQRDLAVAQHRQLVRLLHHAELPFVEGHLFGTRGEDTRCTLVKVFRTYLR